MKVLKAQPSLHHRFDETHHGFLHSVFVRANRKQLGLNRRMFEEDFSRIFRYGDRNEGLLFHVASTDDTVAERLLRGVETRYGSHSLDRTIRELVEDIAQSITSRRIAHYFVRDDAENNEVHIGSLSSIGVAELLGILFQWVPKRTRRRWDQSDETLPAELRILDRAKVMSFRRPNAISRALRAQNGILSTIDAHQFGVASLQPHPTHENPNPTNHFDFGAWRDTQEYALYRATRSTGWNARKYDSSKRSDFFNCYRMIRFRRNQLILRESILSQLGFELSRVGQSYADEFRVEISATTELPTIAFLDDLEERLNREEVGFTEIVDYCLNR